METCLPISRDLLRRFNFVIGGDAAFVDAEEEDDGAAAAAGQDVVPVRHHQLHT